MQQFIIILVIAILVVSLIYFNPDLLSGPGVKVKKESDAGTKVKDSQSQKTGSTVPSAANISSQVSGQKKSSGVSSLIPAQSSKPSFVIFTSIISGPKEAEVVETNKVVFKFKESIEPADAKIQGKIYFETKLLGIDKDWQRTSGKERTITLPLGPAKYTFLVRARTDEVIDSTPAQRNFETNISPYFSKVKISTIKAKDTKNPLLITLKANPNASEKINITDWLIIGDRGDFVIPEGTEFFPVSNNPLVEEDIFVKRGDTIYLIGSSNPLARGTAFRPNKCFGYLAKTSQFPVSISKTCPKPTTNDISYLGKCCQDLISKTPACQFPDYSKSQDASQDSSCVGFLYDYFNYTGCFARYSQDSDFLQNVWHIYMNRDFVPFNEYDTYYLKDQNGFLVDKYEFGKCPACK